MQRPDHVAFQSHVTYENLYFSTTKVPMVNKLDSMVAHLDGLLPTKFHNTLTTWSCDITWQAKTIISPLSQCLWPQNLVECNLYWKAPTHKVTWGPGHVVVQSHVTNKNHYISTTRVPMATKLGRMVAHLDGLLQIKKHEPLITWSCEITWQAKTNVSPLSHCLWSQNLIGW